MNVSSVLASVDSHGKKSSSLTKLDELLNRSRLVMPECRSGESSKEETAGNSDGMTFGADGFLYFGGLTMDSSLLIDKLARGKPH